MCNLAFLVHLDLATLFFLLARIADKTSFPELSNSPALITLEPDEVIPPLNILAEIGM